ncbi:uncharacterized protein LOC119895622 isoform X2 [Micropterus salmoides]|uniref:uncharacterized protein LOC119895622 isoform X2 n=1 Tax=Micropterus salmoides TaxID=27706 RepID=UPI0018EDAE94|nr:uncharacterized protein LOC119895622 isoform X2 [Micropterus salmoides]
MSDISERDWRSALTAILEQLDQQQYVKMKEFLDKIPKGQRDKKSRVTMPQKIIECYGLEESISVVRNAMEEIPRRDAVVQDLLRPFVDKLRNKHDIENKDQQKCCPPDMRDGNLQESDASSWRKSICDLNASGELELGKAIVGKVIQKSSLHMYRNSKDQKKFFCYVIAADETAAVKLMVYGKKHYKNIEEEKSYLFRKLLIHKGCVRVTTESKVSETSPVNVPDDLEMEARTLVCPVCTVSEAKLSADKTDVSVEGTVTEINRGEHVEVKDERKKAKKKSFQLKDDTDSISVCMWGENTKQCKGLSVGDVIKVTNARTNQYHETVSLNSTRFTRIHKVQSAGIQKVRIEILGIVKATKKGTELEVNFNQQMTTLHVSSASLAKAFDLKLDGFKEILLNKMPLSADAVIQGSKIKEITAAYRT